MQVARKELTEKQKKFADELASPEWNGTITELCRKHHISRTTYYNEWQPNRIFTDYVQKRIDQYTDSVLSDVWKSLIDRCLAGDTKAIKLFFELKGKYRQQIDVDLSGVVVFTGEDDLIE